MSLQRYFQAHTNPDRSTSRTSAFDHSMISGYLPFLHNQLLELSDPERPMERKAQRQRFEQQMHHPAVIEAEKQRNEHFLALQRLLPMTLPMTVEMDGGAEALQHFCCDQPAGLPIEIMRARPYGQAEPAEVIAPKEVLTP